MTDDQRHNCETLLAVLEELDEDQCFMNQYIHAGPTVLPPPEERGKPGCGTTACLAGWAAVALAPVIKQADVAVAVPAEWAVEHYVPSMSDSRWLRTEDNEVVVETWRVGRAVLGEEAAAYFESVDGPDQQEMTHQAWMIAVLEGVLGKRPRMPIAVPDDDRIDWRPR